MSGNAMAAFPVTRANHDAVVQGEEILLLDFAAAWCGPCRQLHPVLDAVARAHDLPVGIIDVDQEPDLAARYGVLSVPTVLRIEHGAVVARAQGALPRGRLERLLQLA